MSLFFNFIFFSNMVWADISSRSFLITIKNTHVDIVRPQEKLRVFDVSIKNETATKVYAQIKSKNKVYKRFNLGAGDTTSYSITPEGAEHLFFIGQSPAYPAIELYFEKVAK